MKRPVPILLGVFCVILFVSGLARLFQLRFEHGDVYPAYSSLRADPLGAMAFYESLERTPGLTVRRDYSGKDELPESLSTAYLHLAGDVNDWNWMPLELVTEIESFLAGGGRLVVTLAPLNSSWSIWNTPATPLPPPVANTNVVTTPATNPPIVKSVPPRRIFKDRDENEVDIRERWGFDVGYDALVLDEEGVAKSVTVKLRANLPLPETLEWHSGTIFRNMDETWTTLYARGTNAVFVEKLHGKGTMVIASDSFFVSNEAMQRDRHPGLLAWLVGPARTVVFDESHFGIVESSGVVALMRKYRLHGVMFGFILLAALFIWKNSVSFVPLPAPAARENFVTGKDSAVGFVNLLRHNIPTKDILQTCFDEWTKSLRRRTDYTIAGVEQAQAAMQTELARTAYRRNPVAAYQNIARVLKARRSDSKVPDPLPPQT